MLLRGGRSRTRASERSALPPAPSAPRRSPPRVLRRSGCHGGRWLGPSRWWCSVDRMNQRWLRPSFSSFRAAAEKRGSESTVVAAGGAAEEERAWPELTGIFKHNGASGYPGSFSCCRPRAVKPPKAD